MEVRNCPRSHLALVAGLQPGGLRTSARSSSAPQPKAQRRYLPQLHQALLGSVSNFFLLLGFFLARSGANKMFVLGRNRRIDREALTSVQRWAGRPDPSAPCWDPKNLWNYTFKTEWSRGRWGGLEVTHTEEGANSRLHLSQFCQVSVLSFPTMFPRPSVVPK